MHFDILVEDASGKKALDILVPKIVGDQNTFRITGYKGIGHIPKNLKSGTAANNHLLLNQLPRLLRGCSLWTDLCGRPRKPSGSGYSGLRPG